MKKTISVNISGIAFTIDEDAYQMLESYLNEIERRLNSYGEDSETIKDIESRVSEILREKETGSTFVVNVELIKQVITLVGSPAVFGGDTDSKASYNTCNSKNSYNNKEKSYTKMKKLTRRRDDRVFFGVCGGIADYVGVDALVLRILFAVIFLFSWGTLFFIYLAMGIFVPERGRESSFDNWRRK